MPSASRRVRQSIAPFPAHVEALGMPDMRLKPHMFLLTAIVLLKEIGRPPTVLPTWTVAWLSVASALYRSGGGSETLS